MIKYENDCFGCANETYPCIGDLCKQKQVPHYYCDNCKEEFGSDELYIYDDSEICLDCLLENFTTVKHRLMI